MAGTNSEQHVEMETGYPCVYQLYGPKVCGTDRMKALVEIFKLMVMFYLVFHNQTLFQNIFSKMWGGVVARPLLEISALSDYHGEQTFVRDWSLEVYGVRCNWRAKRASFR